MTLTAMFERPVEAKLMVVTEGGESWPATADDLMRFGFVDPRAKYRRWCAWLCGVLGVDELPEDSPLHAIRYSVECALLYDHMPGDGDEEGDHELLEEVRALASSAPDPTDNPEAP